MVVHDGLAASRGGVVAVKGARPVHSLGPLVGMPAEVEDPSLDGAARPVFIDFEVFLDSCLAALVRAEPLGGYHCADLPSAVSR